MTETVEERQRRRERTARAAGLWKVGTLRQVTCRLAVTPPEENEDHDRI